MNVVIKFHILSYITTTNPFAMNVVIKFHILSYITITNINIAIIFVSYLLLSVLSTANCLAHVQRIPSDATRNSLFEGKTRLGSTPPTCHNKCNQCHPCQAVQVPTMPSHYRLPPSHDQVTPMEYFESSPSYSRNKYSNYKPLGWKCTCGSHFYNP